MQILNDLYVGVPVLNRYDHLQRLLVSLCGSECYPAGLVIVDNGGKMDFTPDMPFPVTVLTPSYNEGCAAAWNRIGLFCHHKSVVLVNDDFILEPDALGRLAQAPGVLAMNKDFRFSCFRVAASVWHDIGYFDEGFWPANYEDEDMECRVRLAGLPISYLPESLGSHPGGRQSQLHEDYYPLLFDRNRRRFEAKWCNGRDQPPVMIPDELDWSFEDYRAHCPDIRQYFGELRAATRGMDKVVEFGSGRGWSTVALLAGRPKVLHSYDIVWRPGQALACHLGRGIADVRLFQKDSRLIDPISADVLFIDSWHTGEQVYSEMTRHAAGVKYQILFHDTVAYGENGEDHLPGLMHGINRYLAECPDTWMVTAERKDWPGLLTLTRKSSVSGLVGGNVGV